MKKCIAVFFIIFSFIILGDEIEDLLSTEKTTSEQKEETIKSDAEVLKVSGQVFVKYDENEVWKQLFEKDTIKEKASIITMENSQAKIGLKNGTVIDIRDKTKVYFEDIKKGTKNEKMEETGVKLLWGKVYSNVQNIIETGSKYEVKVGSSTAGVRGTKFTVWADKEGSHGVTVFEGTVYLARSGKELLIHEKEKVMVEKTGIVKEKQKHTENPPEDISGNTNIEAGLKEIKIKEAEEVFGLDKEEKLNKIIEEKGHNIKNQDEKKNKGQSTVEIN